MIGYVIETYQDGSYEVVLSDSTTGVTPALLAVTERTFAQLGARDVHK
jgi:hypothetical protein